MVEYLLKNKIGVLIIIENNDNIENLRIDGVIIDVNILFSLLILIFNKYFFLYDGVVIIRDNKILYVVIFYKIIKKLINN